jgi:hypothetical protein
MMHPNIVAVYSIRLRPAAPAVPPVPVVDPAWRSPAGRHGSGVLLLDGTQQRLDSSECYGVHHTVGEAAS